MKRDLSYAKYVGCYSYFRVSDLPENTHPSFGCTHQELIDRPRSLYVHPHSVFEIQI